MVFHEGETHVNRGAPAMLSKLEEKIKVSYCYYFLLLPKKQGSESLIMIPLI